MLDAITAQLRSAETIGSGGDTRGYDKRSNVIVNVVFQACKN